MLIPILCQGSEVDEQLEADICNENFLSKRG